jgi:hypothetical protein
MFSPMPPRPLHRWKSFWLGILVLILLVSSWVWSMGHYTSWKWGSSSGGKWAYVGQDSGWIEVGFGGGFGNAPQFWYDGWTHDMPSSWFRQAIHGVASDGRWSVQLAHWLLTLLFLIPWTAFLAWRVRRMKANIERPTLNAEAEEAARC